MKSWKISLRIVGVGLSALFIGNRIYENLHPTTDHLLALAYTGQRTLSLRMIGADHSFLRTRKPQSSSFDHPRALLEAEVEVGRALRAHPGARSSLTQRGWANLLKWSYEAAITDFQQVLDVDPKSAETLTDLATAYFERAESESRFGDYGTAFELQSRALQMQPDNPIAVFNRAITAERLFLFKQCFQDWGHYIAMDRHGLWSDEARERLELARKRYENQQKWINEPLLSPKEFVNRVSVVDSKSWDLIDTRVEDYLRIALTDWIPTALAESHQGAHLSDVRQSLAILANISSTAHGDTWLHDLLKVEFNREIKDGIASLSEAIRANLVTEDFEMAIRLARNAARIFRSHGNLAGQYRATFEEIYALRFADNTPLCLQEANKLASQLSSTSYQWLKIQLQLETGICQGQANDVGEYARLAESATEYAHKVRYPALTLRGEGFEALTNILLGRVGRAESLLSGSLATYWSGSPSAMMGYNLYDHLVDLALVKKNPHLQLALRRQALDMLPPTANFLIRAVALSEAGRVALSIDDGVTAEQELRAALKALEEAPDTRTTDNFRADVDLNLARVATIQGKKAMALALVTRVHSRQNAFNNGLLAASYHRALAEIYGSGEMAEAELEAAVTILEQQRYSIHGERDRVSWRRDAAPFYIDLIQAKLLREDWRGGLATLRLYRSVVNHPPPRDKEDLHKQLEQEMQELDRISSALHDRTRITYALLAQGLAIWQADDRGVRGMWVRRNPADMQMMVRRYWDLCSSPTSPLPLIQGDGKQLYSILIAPLLPTLRTNDLLIIEPDDALSRVPFQALVRPDGRYLVDERPIEYSLGPHWSAPAGEIGTLPNPRDKMVVAVSQMVDPLYGSAIPEDALLEAQEIAERFPNVYRLNTSELSRASIRNDLRDADLIHIVGHASMFEGHPLFAFKSRSKRKSPLVFDSSSIEGLRFPGLKMVALSACSTEGTPDGSIYEADSLVGSFLRAGARRVLASRWYVDSHASRVLMHRYYELVLSGKSFGNALALASIQLRREMPHPYYWAAFDSFE